MFLLRGLLVGATQCQFVRIMPQSKRASKRVKSSEPPLPEMIHCRLLEGHARELLRFTPSREEMSGYLFKMAERDC